MKLDTENYSGGLINYHLARDMQRWIITPLERYTNITPLNFTEESNVAFALPAAEELVEAEEPIDYHEAMRSKDKKL